MATPAPDNRSSSRKAADERITAEAPLAPPALPADAATSSMESHRGARKRPVAMTGVVENGLIRPLDPDIKLPEHSRVIIVASQ